MPPLLYPRLLCFTALTLLTPPAGAALDDRIKAARQALQKGEPARFAQLKSGFAGHPLAPWLDYWQITADLPKKLDEAAVRAFIARNDGSYLAEKIRADWLKFLGKEERWSEFDQVLPGLAVPDQAVSCYALQSRRARGDAGALDAARPLWLEQLDPPPPCQPLLDALAADAGTPGSAVWQRIRLQFDSNRISAARQSIKYLPPTERPSAADFDAVSKKPLPTLLKMPLSKARTAPWRELSALAIERLARSDSYQAAQQMEKFAPLLSDAGRAWAWAQIARWGAMRHQPEALAWFELAGNAALNRETWPWKVRAALRSENWPAVRASIEQMPPALAALPEWVYWLGRANLALGNSEAATALFSRIAGQPNFYGNLASDELGQPISLPPQAAAPSAEEISAAQGNPGLRRSLALLEANLRLEGVREWNWSLRGMNDRQLLAAAETARRANVYDRAIAAADRTQSEHDYRLRYLAPFGEQVRPAARQQGVDDAWVYGLMRQESRFITNARSAVGASGLMQLMPATAKWVAKKIGLRNYHHDKVNDTDVNLLLGTTYMRLVMESLDNHPVLASAAYNAGPGRARRWRAERPIEGAIYAETIPFNETRDYVKKVMSNAVYYAALFEGKPQTLKPRLGVIEPQATAGNEELP